MKRLHLPLLMILLVIFVVPSLGLSVSGQNRKTGECDRRALQDLEERWLHSEDNPEAINKILADDFVHVLPSGFIDKKDQIAHAKQMQSAPAALNKHFEDLRIRVYGDVGIANGMVVTTAPDGTIKRTLFTDVFVRRNGLWKAVNAQELLFQPHPNS